MIRSAWKDNHNSHPTNTRRTPGPRRAEGGQQGSHAPEGHSGECGLGQEGSHPAILFSSYVSERQRREVRTVAQPARGGSRRKTSKSCCSNSSSWQTNDPGRGVASSGSSTSGSPDSSSSHSTGTAGTAVEPGALDFAALLLESETQRRADQQERDAERRTDRRDADGTAALRVLAAQMATLASTSAPGLPALVSLSSYAVGRALASVHPLVHLRSHQRLRQLHLRFSRQDGPPSSPPPT